MHLNDSQVSRIARRRRRSATAHRQHPLGREDHRQRRIAADGGRTAGVGLGRLRDAHHATSHTRAVKITPAAVTTATAASPIASTAFKPGEPEEASLRSRAIRNSGKVTLMAISMPPTM